MTARNTVNRTNKANKQTKTKTTAEKDHKNPAIQQHADDEKQISPDVDVCKQMPRSALPNNTG